MPLDFPIATTTLPNGLRVVVSEDHSVPSVSVNLWVDVGSRHERPGRTGLAHLFEHLMFQGSERVDEGEHMALLMSQGGRANATTSFDRTTYVESVPAGALELALWLEADRLGHLLPAVTQANLDNQRDVVVEEKRQRYDTVPYGQALAHACRLAFPEGHPYHHTTIGEMEDLRAATLEDVHSFFSAHYGPRTLVLTMVGDVSPEEGFALAERYLGHLQDGTVPRPASREPLTPLTEPVTLDLLEEVPSERLYLAFRLPAVTDPDFLPCAMALDALASLGVSRLQLRLLRREETASGVHGTALGLADGTSLGLLVVDVTDGVDPDVVEAAVHEELETLARSGPTEAELEASRADTERSWLEALASFDERAELLSRAVAVFGDAQQVNRYLDDVLAVTAEQVRAAAARWLAPSAAVTLRYRRPAETVAGADERVQDVEPVAALALDGGAR
ncbi:M16 family metallopeptidase [Ornithinimicrobium pekingense]|uniref:Zinc protease n=1 Tax=Ornithinimicrobium pekingense TaxID=384677 RepID=A0ABQ2F9E4_9MICO|nr:pitrilysin family protein [Ornithinimicrobium pekingense]GGK65445.1 zinc protease [Ornithinimicrobium pekingense]